MALTLLLKKIMKKNDKNAKKEYFVKKIYFFIYQFFVHMRLKVQCSM